MEGGSMQKFQKQSEEESKFQSNPTMRMLVIRGEGAYFYKLNEGSADNKTKASIEVDKDFPNFPTAQVGKFAPYGG
jgi:hypothetical protein